MSDVLNDFQTFLNPKAKGNIKGIAKLEITGEGCVMLTENGSEIADAPADVTLKASEQVFRDILNDDQNPVTAFMSGKLKVDGNTQRALKVSSILTA